MNISSFVNQITQTISDASGVKSETMPVTVAEESLRNGLEMILAKGTGQSVTGEILQINGREILLELGENQLLQARLESGELPQTGQRMTFQIQNASGEKISLKPLFENLNQSSQLTSALKAAGLPITDSLVQMVKDMMQEGLPIDRRSLLQMNQAMNRNQGVPTVTLAQMQRLGIPLETNMVQQFQNYRSYEHQLTDSLTELADSFVDSFTQLLERNGSEEGLHFVQDVLGQLSRVNSDQSNTLHVLQEVLDQINQSGGNESASNELVEKMEKLFEKNEFKQLLRETFNEQFLLKPEEVGTEGSVEKLYEKLNQQMKSLNDLLSTTDRADTPLARTVMNLNQNLDFMNAVNQSYAYVQIPLKLYDRETSGELFVYTNKKNLSRKEGTISALLHLDMEHLGSVDVHVTLDQGQKVATKFYLQDDDALNLVAENIDLLNERLSRRGYTVNAEFISRNETTSILEEMLDQSKNISILSDTSFDVRA